MPIIIDGKATSAKIKAGLREKCEAAKQQYGRVPGLAVIIVGEDPASKTYVKNKGIACEACGFYSQTYALPE
ncbi:MAG: bifunctional 5,10-methylene-tetrahydrofolate dehydrogenase/5,10-methylene-tetrahydrofolate cyclohydrolase, partial [Clostridia bacterium]|nr:bifunctional 5,10-methylene-tetrahydrofolate dehydrogenase/5,10-methylene-tetrahydrofolate cyclohydrolase [Clostridia bacterium]